MVFTYFDVKNLMIMRDYVFNSGFNAYLPNLKITSDADALAKVKLFIRDEEENKKKRLSHNIGDEMIELDLSSADKKSN